MKYILDRYMLKQTGSKHQKFFSALVLVGILCFGSSFTLSGNAIAYPQTSAHSSSDIAQAPNNATTDRLPPQVANAVRQDLSRRTRIAPGKLRITQFSRESWPNGCLGLAAPDEICTLAIVPGWRVVVSDGNQTWVYRTNNNGRTVRLESQPVSMKQDNQKIATAIVKSVPIPANELPPALDRDMVFRVISSGGFAGRTYQTTLLKDGSLMRVRIGDANDSERSVRRISPQQVRQFQRLLERSGISRFNGLSYPAPRGAADFITVTITSAFGTTRYADIVESTLPQPVRQVVQAWNRIDRG